MPNTQARRGSSRKQATCVKESYLFEEVQYEKVELELDKKLVEKANRLLKDRGSNLAIYLELQLRAFCKSSAPLRLSDRMPIGKFSGALVEDIVRTDTSYIEWLIGVSTTVSFDPEVTRLVMELSDKPEAEIGRQEISY